MTTEKDLYTIAKEAGMTDEDFVDEVSKAYATHMSMIMDSMGEGIV